MEVMVKLQEAIDNLEATGGALKPNHCERYLIGFKFNKGKWEYEEAAQELEKTYVRDEFGRKTAMYQGPGRLEQSYWVNSQAIGSNYGYM